MRGDVVFVRVVRFTDVTADCPVDRREAAAAYLCWGVCQVGVGGEWLWSVVGRLAPWMPGLIWVRDLVVGDGWLIGQS
jgi:hypothetical protein